MWLRFLPVTRARKHREQGGETTEKQRTGAPPRTPDNPEICGRTGRGLSGEEGDGLSVFCGAEEGCVPW
ncbi:hypothetical protein PBY51_005796 [Eleginops maclovinus]|uniref:Uncharacterized protein n=1 Tax=Eleginops maclovinus TaxID=56733 RepID=A0AAN7ZUN8_ELEMC|nr:hypothetical protein PBY51_005796 [Eleginops maclovinus]